MLQIRDDFEGLRYFATSVTIEDVANLAVNPPDFWIIQRLLIHLFEFFLEKCVPITGVVLTSQAKNVEEVYFCVSCVSLVLDRVSHLDYLVLLSAG